MYIGSAITSEHYLKKVTSPIKQLKQNVATVTVKYTYNSECQALPDNHSDSTKQLQIVGK